MGKAIIIKDADFSAESIGRVSFVKKYWICGVGDKMSLIASKLIDDTRILTATNYYFFGVSSPLVFAGKTITKIAARFKNTGGSVFTIKYGLCDKNATSAAAISNSYVEKGTVVIPYNANGASVDITPFTVPEGKTVIFTMVSPGQGGIPAIGTSNM